MALVRIPKEIWVRLRKDDGLFKAAAQFSKCCEEGVDPPRIYKPSGFERNGAIFHPYLILGLHHHHLHNNPDPLLVTQHIGNVIYGIALTTHEVYTRGDKMLFLQVHEHMIDWQIAEEIREQVLAYVPAPKA